VEVKVAFKEGSCKLPTQYTDYAKTETYNFKISLTIFCGCIVLEN